MHAVATRATVHDYERASAFLREEGAPRVRQAPGFVSAQWVRLAGDKATAILTFASEDAARAAAEQIKANPPGGEFVTIDSIEVGEVIERI